MIFLSGPIKIKLDSGWKTDGRTERDEVSVEVNISQRGYNDPCELGLGLWGVESEEERKRSKRHEMRRMR